MEQKRVAGVKSDISIWISMLKSPGKNTSWKMVKIWKVNNTKKLKFGRSETMNGVEKMLAKI